MKEVFNHLELERLADETAAQAFGVGFNDLDRFITQQCESRRGGKASKALDVILGRLFQHRNRLLRVEFPDEILLDILKLAVNFDWVTDITGDASYRDLWLYYRDLYSIQRVNRRWHDIIVSYAPFWSLISTTMPKNMIKVALTRAKESTRLCIRAKRDEEESLRHFMDMVLPLSSRIGSLMIDLTLGNQVLAPLLTHLPTVQNLLVGGAEDIPFNETSSALGIPSPRWIHLIGSALPTMPTLYARLEELTIECPLEEVRLGALKSIVLSAPRLRILRVDRLMDEGPDNKSQVEPLPMPNLQLLHIGGTNHAMGSTLDCFQLSPSASIQMFSSDWNVSACTSKLEGYIRSKIWAVLHSMTESSFCLELGPSTYKLQTRKTLIEIDVGDHNYSQWPDFFKDFVPRVGQAPIRVYIFLKATRGSSGKFPNQDCIAGLQSDLFFMV
ncbi:hypothetical protein FRC04_009837 [Tulasnella sp. 424]|nr:hypothetical protein FRC04_009837 [Tulasnella sp. 424]KAG8972905.1 hypothetical protein FRC05_009459 [Tulasnella sp. 425]